MNPQGEHKPGVTPLPNLTIRREEPDDYIAIQKILSGPRAVWGTMQIPYPSVENWRKRLAEMPEGFFPLVACVDGEPIGQIVLETYPRSPRRHHVAGLGMSVRDDWQGKGVGTALMQAAVDLADRWLNITRIELEVYTDNEPGIRLYKRFGFVIEGTLSCFAFRDGRYVDVYTMARFRPDWQRPQSSASST